MIKSKLLIYSTYFNAGLSTIVFLAGWITGSNLFMLFGLAIIFLPLLLTDDQHLFALIFFYIPNITMFKIPGYENTVIGILIILFFIKIIISGRIRFNRTATIGLLIYCLASFVSMLINWDFSEFPTILRYSADILIFFSLCTYYKGTLCNLFIRTKNYFIAGTLSTIGCGLVYNLANNLDIRNVRFAGINNDPNYYGVIMAVAFSITLLTILSKFTESKTLNALLAILFLIAGMMSLSRGFVVAISINTIIILHIIFSYKISSQTKIKTLVATGLALIFMGGILSQYISLLLSRFPQTVALGANRPEIWKLYIDLTTSGIKTSLFGWGSSTYLFEQGMVSFVPHNTIIDIYVAFGILGILTTILLYFTFARALKNICNIRHLKFVGLCPLITLVMGYLFISGMHSDSLILISLLALLMCSVYSRGTIQKNHYKSL